MVWGRTLAGDSWLLITGLEQTDRRGLSTLKCSEEEAGGRGGGCSDGEIRQGLVRTRKAKA